MSRINESSQESLLGKYNIVSKLGQGAMGMVYKGFDPSIERYVALKTVSSHILNMGDSAVTASLKRFKQEAKIAGRLNHPHIVSVYEYGEDQQTIFIAMEYVEGKELKQIFTEQPGPWPVSKSVGLMIQLLEALKHAHGNGVIHRDIKPGNIIVRPNGDIKVTDFGIARIESSELTQMGTLLGTPSYMAPEMINEKQVDARSDLFSAGVVFYQCLTGGKPFDGAAHQVMNKILTTAHTPPSAIVPDLPPELDRIVDKALAKDPAQRYPSADAMLIDLKGLLAGPEPSYTGIFAPPQSPPAAEGTPPDASLNSPPPQGITDPSPPGTQGQPEKRRSSAMPLILSLVFLGLVIIAAVWVYYDRVMSVESPGTATAPKTAQETVKPEKPTFSMPEPLALSPRKEKIKVLEETLKSSAGKVTMSMALDMLRLNIAFKDNTGGAEADLLDSLAGRILSSDRVIRVFQGAADLICTLDTDSSGPVLTLKNRFLVNAPDAVFPARDLLEGPKENQVNLAYMIDKLYAFNAFDLLQSVKPPAGNAAYIEFSGTHDNTFRIGQTSDICIHPDQEGDLVLFNINSMDITMLFPHFKDTKTHVLQGQSKCSGKVEICPPAGTEMIASFLLKDRSLMDRFGYTLSEKTGFCTWAYEQGRAGEFCENLMFQLLNALDQGWSVDTRLVQIRN